MSPEQRIDAALEAILRASGLSLNQYTHKYAKPARLADMREAMREVMSDSYISGSHDNFNAMQKNRG